jgi:hypothetical protein
MLSDLISRLEELANKLPEQAQDAFDRLIERLEDLE